MRILIVGAGIAGLATHRALSLRGFKPTIVDRNPGPGEGGAGLFPHEVSVSAQEPLRLLLRRDRLRRRGTAIDRAAKG